MSSDVEGESQRICEELTLLALGHSYIAQVLPAGSDARISLEHEMIQRHKTIQYLRRQLAGSTEAGNAGR